MANFSFSTETFILFNLEKISNHFGTNQINIEKCFEYHYRRKYKTSFHCSLCQKIENNISEDKIYSPPKILIVILDRGKGKSFKGNISFGNDLDLKEYIDEENYTYNSKYKLISLITHSGSSSASGHYTACCLTDNGKNYYFNDQNADEIDNLLNYNGDPYILFYRRCENNQQNNYYANIYEDNNYYSNNYNVNNYNANNYGVNNYDVNNCDANNDSNNIDTNNYFANSNDPNYFFYI